MQKEFDALFTHVRFVYCAAMQQPVMNSELQAQSDALCNAINAAATTAHRDALLLCAVLGTLLVILIIIALVRKP